VLGRDAQWQQSGLMYGSKILEGLLVVAFGSSGANRRLAGLLLYELALLHFVDRQVRC
jgi:hypothetical protein